MYGVGYPVLEKAAHGEYVAGFLPLLLAGKILAASLTIGIGGSGGVFAPSLFIGAMLGAAYGATTHQLVGCFRPGGRLRVLVPVGELPRCHVRGSTARLCHWAPSSGARKKNQPGVTW